MSKKKCWIRYRDYKNLECSRYYQKEPLPIQFSVPGHTRLYREVNINQYRVTHEQCHPSARKKSTQVWKVSWSELNIPWSMGLYYTHIWFELCTGTCKNLVIKKMYTWYNSIVVCIVFIVHPLRSSICQSIGPHHLLQYPLLSPVVPQPTQLLIRLKCPHPTPRGSWYQFFSFWLS